MKPSKKIKIIVTHNGKFHADDVFAVATVSLVFGKKFRLIRTRDENIISKGDIVIDVGGVYNNKRNRFDHHQMLGAGKRKNGIPYSSLGLVWKKFGREVCGDKKISDYLDKRFIQQIDAVDNGFDIAKLKFDVPSYNISDVIDAWVPAWDEKVDTDKAFQKAVDIAKKILQREIIKAKSKFKAEKFVKAAYYKSRDKRIIVLDKYYPSQELAVNFMPKTKFIIYPQNGVWSVRATRRNLLDFKIKNPFPRSWSGKRDGELIKISGIKDAIFCHRNLFLAVAKSREGAIRLAKIALNKK